MGADFLYTEARYPEGYKDNPDEADRILRERLDTISDDDLASAAGWPEEHGPDVRKFVCEGLELLANGGGRRDTIDLDDRIATGGMSWGDTPTDAWDPLDCLSASGICDKPMPWVDRWSNDLVQFARLIAELEAAGGFNDIMRSPSWDELLVSTDLEAGQVMELLDRAQKVWDQAKEDHLAWRS